MHVISYCVEVMGDLHGGEFISMAGPMSPALKWRETYAVCVCILQNVLVHTLEE